MKTSTFKIVDLKIDHQSADAFVGSAKPVFSWRLETDDAPGFLQTAYRIEAMDEHDALLWDSGQVDSALSAEIPWGGAPLPSRLRGWWRVTVWDNLGRKRTSEKVSFETTLLHNRDWQARWIWFDGNNTSAPSPAPYFRHVIVLPKKKIRYARLYAAAHGVFLASMNGQKISEDCFAPGWTDFNRQCQFVTYDVTKFLRQGARNALGFILGDGWYCSYTSGRQRNFYGKHPELLVQLEITFADGTRFVSVSESQRWRCTTGPILYSDLYDGEFYDARLEIPGWDMPAFRGNAWKRVAVGKRPNYLVPLTPKRNPPVRRIAEIKPVAVLHPRPDTWIWDMGQNITGNVRIRIGGYPGRLYTIRYGEMLYDDGTLYNLNYRSARSTDYYTVRNESLEEPGDTFEPHFTFHGFRYVQIDGFQFAPFPVEKVEVTGIVISSALERTGTFECGHAKLNQLYSNVRWGQIDNFLEIPTDCPQRDERLGWTGDAEIFCGAACCNFDSNNFLRKYLGDVRDAQRHNGAVASIAPDVIRCAWGAAAWADAIAIIPWTLYHYYASVRVLEENIDAICAWVDFEERSSKGHIRPETDYADWLAFSKITTPSSLIGTAYFYKSTCIAARACELVGRRHRAKSYQELAEAIYEAFHRTFVGDDGIVAIQTQTALALALNFGLIPPEHRAANARRLAELVKANGNCLDTGFVGTRHLNSALSENGQGKTAYDLYLQEKFPSWLFSVNQGATTIWERWNSYTKKDGFGDVNMNSFNHYAYGAIHEWVVNTVCGIRLASPAGHELEFACIPDKRLGYAKGSLKTPYGLVTSEWRFTADDKLEWIVSAPPNTVSQITIPEGWQPVGRKRSLKDLPGGTYELTLRKAKAR